MHSVFIIIIYNPADVKQLLKFLIKIFHMTNFQISRLFKFVVSISTTFQLAFQFCIQYLTFGKNNNMYINYLYFLFALTLLSHDLSLSLFSLYLSFSYLSYLSLFFPVFNYFTLRFAPCFFLLFLPFLGILNALFTFIFFSSVNLSPHIISPNWTHPLPWQH